MSSTLVSNGDELRVLFPLFHNCGVQCHSLIKVSGMSYQCQELLPVKDGTISDKFMLTLGKSVCITTLYHSVPATDNRLLSEQM